MLVNNSYDLGPSWVVVEELHEPCNVGGERRLFTGILKRVPHGLII